MAYSYTKYSYNTIKYPIEIPTNASLKNIILAGSYDSTGTPTNDASVLLFGLQDSDNNFLNNLGEESEYELTCSASDCSSAIHTGINSTYHTALNIWITLGATTQQRTVTYSYKGTPLFSILQGIKDTSITYTYTVFIRNIGSNGIYPSITSNSTLTDSPSSWSAIKISSSIYPLCTMSCYYGNSTDNMPSNIYMSSLCIAGENKKIKYYDDGESWSYGTQINLFYFSGQNCKLQGTYNLPFGKNNDNQYITL